MSIHDVDTAFRALADPTRRQILALVADAPLSAGEIARHFEVSRPAISQHLTVLHDAGFLTQRREGTRRLYQAESASVEEIVEHLRSFWSPRLQRLKRAAEREERHRRGRR